MLGNFCMCLGATSCLFSCVNSMKNTRVPYFGILVIAAIIAAIGRYWKALTDGIIPFTICTSERCFGFNAVYRITSSLFVFYLLMALLVLVSRNSRSVDTGFWLIKILVLVAITIGFWFLPSNFFEGFSQVARVGAGFFLLFQIIVLIEWIFATQELWLERGWKTLILISSILLIGLGITFDVFLVKNFFLEGCNEQKIVGVLSMILSGVCLILSVSGLSRHGLLPGALVMGFGSYSMYSALASGPAECKVHKMDDTLMILLGVITAVISLAYSSYSVAYSTPVSTSSNGEDVEDLENDGESIDVERRQKANRGALISAPATPSTNPNASTTTPFAQGTSIQYSQQRERSVKPSGTTVNYLGTEASSDSSVASDVNAMPNASHHVLGDGASSSSAYVAIEDDDVSSAADVEKVASKNAFYFHIILALASCYLAMLLTSWGSIRGVEEEDKNNPLDVSPFSMWIKIIAQLITYGLYIFTFFAPMCFPNREFS